MTKIDLKRRAEIGEERRQKRLTKFVNSAMSIIAEEGSLYALSVDSLVRKTGASRGTFYNYFNNIEDVITAVAQYLTVDLNNRILLKYSDVESGPVRLSYSLLKFFEKAEQDRIWGTVFAKLILDLGLISDKSIEYFEHDLNIGREQGSFTLMDNQIATNIVGGVLAFTINSVLKNELNEEQKFKTLVSLLMALGTPHSTSQSAVKKAFDI